MGSVKTFSSILTSTPPKPTKKPSPWEAYLLSLIQNLQKENTFAASTSAEARDLVDAYLLSLIQNLQK